MAVFAPMPRESESTATATKTGDFLKVRTVKRRSCARLPIALVLPIAENVTGALRDSLINFGRARAEPALGPPAKVSRSRFSRLRHLRVSAGTSGPVIVEQ